MAEAKMTGCSGWDALTGELFDCIASLLPPNEVACTLRISNKLGAKALKGWTLLRLSQPVPHHAFVRRWGGDRSTHDLNLRQKQQLLCLTAHSGRIVNLEVALAAAGCPLTKQVFISAAVAGQLDMCLRLLELGCPRDDNEVVSSAAKAGHAAVVRWALEGAPNPDARAGMATLALVAAAGGGRRALCEELLAAGAGGSQCRAAVVWTAAEGGHVELTSWLLERLVQPMDEDEESRLLVAAAYGFDLPSLQRLSRSRLGDEADSEEFAATFGHDLLSAAFLSPAPDWRDKVEWLEAAGCGLEEDGVDLSWAIDNGWEPLCSRPDAVERVTLLRQRGGLVAADNEVVWDAVRSGNLPVLRYLRAEGLVEEPDGRLADAAAAKGDVAALAELLAAGCPIGPDAVKSAARGGHLRLLQWMAGPEARPAAAGALAEMVGCTDLAACAAESGSVELMEWLRERGCRWDARTYAVASHAGNSAAFLEWLEARGCPK